MAFHFPLQCHYTYHSFECWSGFKAALRPGCEHGQLLQPPLSRGTPGTVKRSGVYMRANVHNHTLIANLCSFI